MKTLELTDEQCSIITEEIKYHREIFCTDFSDEWILVEICKQYRQYNTFKQWLMWKILENQGLLYMLDEVVKKAVKINEGVNHE